MNANPPSSKVTSGFRVNDFESSLTGKVFEILERAGVSPSILDQKKKTRAKGHIQKSRFSLAVQHALGRIEYSSMT